MRLFRTAIGMMIGLAPSLALAQGSGLGTCDMPSAIVTALQSQLQPVVALPDANGGIFAPNRVYAAIVDRRGKLCAVTVANDAWPSARDVAIALAETANGFSNSGLALSTANLYGLTQPGGQFYGLNTTNPGNPAFLVQGSGLGFVPGGIVSFGGGVALYSGGQVIGGLGVAGDSSCAGHAIAYRMRRNAGLDGIPGGASADGTDNISYYPTATVVPSQFAQPHCFPTDIRP